MISRESYRDAMARLGAAVSVITTAGAAGQGGFTASAVCSVTDEPPTLLVCMNRGSELNAIFKANRVLCVNVLAAAQEELSPLFGGLVECDMPARFEAASWSALVTGSPVLEECAVAFDCRIAQVTEVGTHSVFFCEIEALRVGLAHEGLIYFGRAYHRIRVLA
ncbi:MAG: flavin reductase [Acidisphaera sp.]|nr:flavin reductase [Acidisphaera sp.]